MSILDVKTSVSTDGIKKTIDKDSNDVALDILQRGIYAYPIKSTVRELASNCHDANVEREMAKSILNGESKVEDHFDLDLVDGVYHASGWDPDYYNMKYLSDDPNTYIFYEEGIKKDVLRIKDNGIGLGKDRLVGYFQLAYSSKRTQKGALGKWGLGNKSALSLGVDSFTVINRYEGKKFRFEVYLDNVISTTPMFSGGKKNDSITVTVAQPTEDGGSIDKDFVFFYEETDELNGLEIVIPVKKYEKPEFLRAIEEQLMYIPNIVVKVKEQNALDYKLIDIAAKVVYQDESIIISKSTVFDRPHLLLGTGKGLINYGAIDFDALELEPKRGAVGLILDINDVEVTPSRESVIWSKKTRAAVIKSYNEIVETATKVINNELKQATDYWEWITKAASIKNALANNTSSDGSVLQKLSGIIDASSVNKIYYTNNKMTKLYTSDMKSTIGDRLLLKTFSYSGWDKKVVRTKIKSVNSVAGLPAYVTDGASDKYKDRYLYEEVWKNKAFLVIKRLEGWQTIKTSSLIGNSNLLISYDEVEIPEDIMDRYILEESNGGGMVDDEDSVQTTIDPNRLAKLRKLEEKILVHYGKHGDPITYSSREVKISSILSDFAGKYVIYGSFDNRGLMNSILSILPPKIFDLNNLGGTSYHFSTHDEFKETYQNIIDKFPRIGYSAMLISKENEKHFVDKSNFIHISDFIIENYTNGKLVFNPVIRYGLTMLYMNDIIRKYSIRVSGVNTIDYDEAKNFFGKEFVDLMAMNMIASGRLSNRVTSFLKHSVSYELGKDTLDQEILNDYLTSISDVLPDELCDTIDEISDVHIIDVELVNKMLEYCTFYSQFNPILHSISYGGDAKVIKLLDKITENYEKKPTPLGRIQ